MADIDVERKSGTSWIWWLLGLIVLALIIWAVVEAMRPDTANQVAPAAGTADTTSMVAPAPVPLA